MDEHHYTECGLSNVVIRGIQVEIDDDGDEVITIPAINELHRVIAEGIVRHEHGMSGEELRFLRTEMGMTQAELARLVHRDKQSVGRWERNEKDLDSASETVIRRQAIELLGLDVALGIGELSQRSVSGVPACSPSISTAEVANDDGGTHYSLRAA